MPGLIYDLMDTLEAQIVHVDELAELSGRKKGLIITNDVAELSKLTAEENAVVNKIQKLDRTRESLMTDIANVIGQTADMTLTTLTELMKHKPEYDKLSALTAATKEKFEALRVLNEQNKILVENSLEYIDFTINAIRTSVMPEQALYSTDGEELGVRQSFFDARQ